MSWRHRLSEFDFDIIRRESIKKQAIDALTRPETRGWSYTDMDDDHSVAIMDLSKDTYEAVKA